MILGEVVAGFDDAFESVRALLNGFCQLDKIVDRAKALVVRGVLGQKEVDGGSTPSCLFPPSFRPRSTG